MGSRAGTWIVFKRRWFVILAAAFWSMTGCAPHRTVVPPSEFLLGAVEPGDTFASLALRYLKDPSLGWLVAEFNRTETLAPGEVVLIPLYPYRMGGIEKTGHQVVPVLLYRWEAVLPGQEGPDVQAEAFRRQMAFLREAGYTVISLPQLSDFLDFKTLLPQRSVVITFDDPDAGFFDAAFPVLRTFGYPAAVFVQTEAVGMEGRLTWEQLLELSANGVSVESRGRRRGDLDTPAGGESDDRYLTVLEEELVRSRAQIEAQTGKASRYLAYPSGEAKRLTTAYAEKAGYRAAFISGGAASPFFADRYRLGRTPVPAGLDIDSFRKLLKTFESTPSQ